MSIFKSIKTERIDSRTKFKLPSSMMEKWRKILRKTYLNLKKSSMSLSCPFCQKMSRKKILHKKREISILASKTLILERLSITSKISISPSTKSTLALPLPINNPGLSTKRVWNRNPPLIANLKWLRSVSKPTKPLTQKNLGINLYSK